MIVDAHEIPAETVLEADLCIVGCGAAGTTIARELAESSLRVVVLESGGLDFESDTNDLNVGDIVGLPYFPLETARLRYLGGSTNHWGGVCRPLEPIDFEARDWIPESGWPITRTDLDPYYPRAASTAGLSIADWDLGRWSAKSPFPVWPFSGDPIETVVAQVVDGKRRSFGRRFRTALQAATNVTIQLHANAISIDTDASGRHVERSVPAPWPGTGSPSGPNLRPGHGWHRERPLAPRIRRHRPDGVGNEHDWSAGTSWSTRGSLPGSSCRPIRASGSASTTPTTSATRRSRAT